MRKPKTLKFWDYTLSMSRFRSLHRHIDSLLRLRNHLFGSQATDSLKFFSLPSTSQRTRSFSLKFDQRIGPEIADGKINRRPDFTSKEAVKLKERVECYERESGNEDGLQKGNSGEAERGMKRLQANSRGEEKLEGKDKPGNLYVLFSNQNECAETREVRMKEDPLVRKELSPDMVMLVRYLFREGYFNYGNFLPNKKLVLSYFEYRYGRDFIKFAAERFGRDKQEIAKWLSGSDLKKVALFGCPSIARKNVFAAKRLRKFFGIQEDTVCHKCIFRQSCKYVNQSVWSGGTKNLNLAVVMKVITQYALETVPPQLVIPEDIKASVSRLLKEILKLSTTVSRN